MMKQSITEKQWHKLTDEEKETQYEMSKEIFGGGANTPSDITTELPNIGRMLEFLNFHNKGWFTHVLSRGGLLFSGLCDLLWVQVVKEVRKRVSFKKQSEKTAWINDLKVKKS